MAADRWQEEWQGFLETGELEAMLGSYAVLDRVGAADIESCTAYLPELAAALDHNPFAVSLRTRWLACREALGEDIAADLRTAQAQWQWMRREQRGSSMLRPVEVPTEVDAAALIEAWGWQPLYARYLVGASNGSLPLAAIVWDPDARRERTVYLDFLGVWQALSREHEDARFPAFLHGLSERYLLEAVAAGNSTAELADVSVQLGRGELGLEDAVLRLEELALAGSAPAAFELLPLCAIADQRAHCERSAFDLVAGLAGRQLSEAMIVLALAHERGIGTGADTRAMRRWLDRAGKRIGQPQAQLAFARLSATQDRGQPLSVEAERALRAAAGKGLAAAQLTLAQWLGEQRLRPRRGESAERWLRKAALSGSNQARTQLAMSELRAGRHAQAREWVEKAAAEDDGTALGLLALGLENGSLGQTRDPQQALRLLERAAALGNVGAMRRLARAHRDGHLGLEADARMAEGWYLSAAVAGSPVAPQELAEMYLEQPPGFEQRAPDGYALLQRLAADGSTPARLRMAVALLQGEGVEADPPAAIEQLQLLEQEGQAAASFRLGQIFQFGQGASPIDEPRARQHYRRAADKGHLMAIDYYARMLYEGRGGERDRRAGADWWQRAAERGNLSAGNNLAWVRCVSEDADLRDPSAGLAIARKVYEQRRDSAIGDTLAACHAATGDFTAALRLQGEAIASAAGDDSLDEDDRAGLDQRLASYQRGEAWVEPGER